MFGRIVPSAVWDSSPVRSIRRPFAAAMEPANAWLKSRRDILRARDLGERLLTEHNGNLAAGGWRLLLIRIRRRGGQVRSMLVHESLSLDEALNVWDLSEEYAEAWFDDWRTSVQPSGVESDLRLEATIVMPRHSETSLLFDFQRRVVLRRTAVTITPEYERLRRSFSRYVPSTPFEVLPDRQSILESLVEGHQLSDVTWEAKVEAVMELLERLPRVLVESGEGDSIECLSTAIDAADPMLGVLERRSEIIGWLGAAPKIPSHGDLVPGNIRLTDSGAVCVDFGACAIQPAWFDGLKLALWVVRDAERTGVGDPSALESSLHQFLRRVTPGSPPHDWRRLAGLTFAALRWGKPPESWVGQSDGEASRHS